MRQLCQDAHAEYIQRVLQLFQTGCLSVLILYQTVIFCEIGFLMIRKNMGSLSC